MTLTLQPVRPEPVTTSTLATDAVAAYLDAALDSPNTRRAYTRHLRDALGVMGCAQLSDLHGSDLAGYRAAVTRSGLAPASQAQALAALRAFLGWARTMGAHQLPKDVITEALRTPRAKTQTAYQILNEAEITAMFTTARTARDSAILGVLLGAGLRVSELAALDVRDVVEDADGEYALHVRAGKGRKDRLVPIRDEVATLVRSYLVGTGRTLSSPGPMFRAHDRGAMKRERRRLTARAVGDVVRSVATEAAINAKRVTPHALRHTYALRALRQGGDVVAVSKLLGHASITTTQRYVDHLATGELRAAVPALPLPTG